MVINSIYILSKSGGLIFNYDHKVPIIENEKTFSYPLTFQLRYENRNVVVKFGQQDGIRIGHVLTSINGQNVDGRALPDGTDVFTILASDTNYPINIKFTKPRLTTNEKIFTSSMFYPIFAIACQLSPEEKCAGIKELVADTFKLHCFQTLTGIKIMVVADPFQEGIDVLLGRIYELYADYSLKNPFYNLEMPIRCELFDVNLKLLLDRVDKMGIINI